MTLSRSSVLEAVRPCLAELEIARRLRTHRGKDRLLARFIEEFNAKDAVATFRAHKTSDTLYILGSGPSINDITPAQWDHVGHHDSFGFNNWPVHSFVPSFYMTEVNSTETLNPAMLRMFEDRATDYANVPVLIKEPYRYYKFVGVALPLDQLPATMRRNYVTGPQFIPPAMTRATLAAQLRAWKRMTRWFPALSHHLITFRASVFLAMHMGFLGGWQRIVLAGIDMRSPKYFWEEQGGYTDYGLPSNDAVSSVHRTEEASLGLPISQAIEIFDHVLLQPAGIRLEVSSSYSLLSDFLPVHAFET